MTLPANLFLDLWEAFRGVEARGVLDGVPYAQTFLLSARAVQLTDDEIVAFLDDLDESLGRNLTVFENTLREEIYSLLTPAEPVPPPTLAERVAKVFKSPKKQKKK